MHFREAAVASCSFRVLQHIQIWSFFYVNACFEGAKEEWDIVSKRRETGESTELYEKAPDL